MKDRLVVLIDSELKKNLQIAGIKKNLNITEVTELAIKTYLESLKEEDF